VQDLKVGTIVSSLLQEPTKYKNVHLLYGNMTEFGVSKILPVLEKTSIQWLNLGFNRISDQGIFLLMRGLEGSSVTYLDIKANYFSDIGARSIAHSLPKTNISTLDIGNNRLGEAGVKELCQSFAKAPKLFELFASLLNITDRTVEMITPALAESNLNKLYLGSNLISDKGVGKLCYGLKKINYLHLNNNLVTDKGIEHLVKILPLMVIKVLNLHMNRLTDKAMAALGKGLSKNKEVFTLDLSYNCVTKAGASLFLENLGRAEKLNKFNLQYNQIHGENKKELQELCNQKKVTLLIHRHS